MKATIKLVPFFFLFLLVACGTKGKKVEATEAKASTTETAPKPTANPNGLVTYNLNKGGLNWVGSKLVGTSSHTGTINIVLGDIRAKGTEIISGQFTIDMESIANTDLKPDKGKDKLERHLKSADFFDIEKFPRATFIITGSAPATGEDITHNITGNLTIKDISKSITIPANIAVVSNKLTAVTPAFKIDRTQWGVQYGSGSIAGIAKDKIINNDISLVLNIEATSNTPVQ